MSTLHSVRMRVISLAAAAVVGAVFLLPVSQGVAEHHEGSVAKFDSEGTLWLNETVSGYGYPSSVIFINSACKTRYARIEGCP